MTGTASLNGTTAASTGRAEPKPFDPVPAIPQPEPAASLAKDHATPAQTQRAVGLLLDGECQEGWVVGALRQALEPQDVRLHTVVVLRGTNPDSVTEKLHRSLESSERWLRRRKEPLFLQIDIPAALSAPMHEVQAARDEGGWYLDADGLAVLRALAADLWLCVTATPPRRPLPELAAGGVWGIEIGAVPASNPWAGAGEVGARVPLTLVRLVDYSSSAGGSRARAHYATVRNSLCNNRLRGLRMGLGLLRWITEDPPPADAVPPEPQPTRPQPPRLGAIARSAWRVASTVAANRLRSTAFLDQWQIGYHFTDERNADARWLHYLVPPTDRFWADPFAVEHDGRHFIFFEELKYREQRGRIMAMEVFEHREPDEPRHVLEKPYHLSYPFIFEWQGQYYLLPESAENRTVELYRCESFPDRWSLHQVLLEGISAYDATLWREGARWWMFTTVSPFGSEGHDELHLYFSESPFGPWRPHRRNPVITDVRCARSAGPLYTRNGALYRPSQDCSLGYGHSVVINRIDVLDENNYRQVPVNRINPGWRPDIRRVHTVGAAGRLRVLDCQVRRTRLPHRRLGERFGEWLDWTTRPVIRRGGF